MVIICFILAIYIIIAPNDLKTIVGMTYLIAGSIGALIGAFILASILTGIISLFTGFDRKKFISLALTFTLTLLVFGVLEKIFGVK